MKNLNQILTQLFASKMSIIKGLTGRTLTLWDEEAKGAQRETLEPQNAGAVQDKRVNKSDGLEGLG